MRYNSPLIGKISDKQINEFKLYKGITEIESIFKNPTVLKGEYIYNSLLNKGYTQDQSSSIVKHFCANERMNNYLLERGISEEEISSFNYKTKLKMVGLERSSCLFNYALQSDIKIYPIKEIPTPKKKKLKIITVGKPPEIEEPIEEGVITRTLYATVSMRCCRDGDTIYEPEDRDFSVSERKAYFKDTLAEWVNKISPKFEEETHNLAEAECEGMGATPRLCHFEFRITNSEEVIE